MTAVARMRRGDLLAAYGLLRPAASGLDRLGVRGRIEPVGACPIPGRLIDLGDYPALIGGEGVVQGDLLRLLDDEVGAIFDDFEDFDPGAPATSVYVRERVRLSAPALEAWVYIWNGSETAGPVVASGDWLTR
jgi:gamma-glutamylcyclotransferase (GGCT)/AIG2-like uncharacterized protein YtfP